MDVDSRALEEMKQDSLRLLLILKSVNREASILQQETFSCKMGGSRR